VAGVDDPEAGDAVDVLAAMDVVEEAAPAALEDAQAALLGQFDQAVEWQTKALKAAEGIPGANLEGDRSRLKLYQDKKPFRNERGKPSGT